MGLERGNNNAEAFDLACRHSHVSEHRARQNGHHVGIKATGARFEVSVNSRHLNSGIKEAGNEN